MTGREDLTAEEISKIKTLAADGLSVSHKDVVRLATQLECTTIHDDVTMGLAIGACREFGEIESENDQLKAELAKLREANRVWRFSERQPVVGQMVLVFTGRNWFTFKYEGTMNNDSPRWSCVGDWHEGRTTDTWQEMPPPPGEKTT